MSTTQGEPKQSVKSTIIGGAVALVLITGAFAGVAVASENARAQANQLHLLSVAKSSSIIMEAATTEDATVAADATQAQSVAYTDQKAADAQAAYDAKIAAEKAAAKAAADAAAAQAAKQQAARQATVQQASTASDPVAAPVKCPAGTIAQAVDANGNESNCQPLGPTGTQCVAYDANNTCTQWYDPNK